MSEGKRKGSGGLTTRESSRIESMLVTAHGESAASYSRSWMLRSLKDGSSSFRGSTSPGSVARCFCARWVARCWSLPAVEGDEGTGGAPREDAAARHRPLDRRVRARPHPPERGDVGPQEEGCRSMRTLAPGSVWRVLWREGVPMQDVVSQMRLSLGKRLGGDRKVGARAPRTVGSMAFARHAPVHGEERVAARHEHLAMPICVGAFQTRMGAIPKKTSTPETCSAMPRQLLLQYFPGMASMIHAARDVATVPIRSSVSFLFVTTWARSRAASTTPGAGVAVARFSATTRTPGRHARVLVCFAMGAGRSYVAVPR